MRKCAFPNVHLPKCMFLNVMLTLPPPFYTLAVLVTVLRTCQTTLCHIFVSINYGPCFQPYPPPVWWRRSHLHHSQQLLLLAAVFIFCTSDALPPPPASVVDSFINPTSVGNRIAAVQAVLSSEHAQTPVTLSSDQLKAILRIPLSPSPFMHVVDVIALRSDVSTISAPRIPPPSPASLASATIATGTNFPTPSAAVTAAIFCQSTPTTLKGEAELCSSRRSQPLTFSKLPSQTADKLPLL